MNLPVMLDTASGVPIYVQLEQQIRLLIRSGRLASGAAMPTVRELAVFLGINFNTVARIYRDLQREGMLVSRRGVGTFVADEPAAAPLTDEAMRHIDQLSETLIAKARSAGMTSAGLARLIETKWKETP